MNISNQQLSLNADLLKAAKNDDWASAKKAIQAGADILTQDENGDSAAILFACHGNCRAVIGMAKINKATLELTDNTGSTPGICFAMHNHADAAVNVASEYPHIVRQVNDRGNSMATWFAQYQNVKTVLALAYINGGVFAQEDKDGPITWKRFQNHVDVESVRRLKEHEIKVRTNW